jgi:hypothetical protein
VSLAAAASLSFVVLYTTLMVQQMLTGIATAVTYIPHIHYSDASLFYLTTRFLPPVYTRIA